MRRSLIYSVILLLGTMCFAVVADEAQAAEKIIPSSIAKDCSKDVSSAFGDWIDTIQPGDTAKLQPGGCYIVNETIGFGKNGATFDGAGGTIRRTKLTTETGSQFHMLRISGASNVTVRGTRFEVRDGGPEEYQDKHAFEHAISVLDSTNTLLTQLSIDKPRGDCLYVRGAARITGKDVNCTGAKRQGIGFVRGTDAVFDNFDMTGVIRSGLDFEPNHVDHEILRVSLLNSTIGVGNLPVTSQGRNAAIRDILIQNNDFIRGKGMVWGHQTSPGDDACYARTGTRSNWRILGNRGSGIGSYGGAKIVLCAIDGFEIAGNQIVGPDPVLLEATKGGSVKLNQFPGSAVAYKAKALQSTPVACGNVLSGGLDRQCGGTEPPPSSTTTTTTIPIPPSSTTTTTLPPPPTTISKQEFIDQLRALLDAYEG